jgi:hypothetical protein
MDKKQDNQKEPDQELKNNLMRDFHYQFAENQKHHQSLVIRLITTLGGIFIGVGYVGHGYLNNGSNNDGSFKALEFAITILVAQILLTILVSFVSHLASSFRRDQLVNFKIRDNVNLINNENSTNNENFYGLVFSKSFDPRYKFGCFWKVFPDFHRIFTISFLVFQFVLWILSWSMININSRLVTLILVLILFGLIVSVIVVDGYSEKISNNNKQEIK